MLQSSSEHIQIASGHSAWELSLCNLLYFSYFWKEGMPYIGSAGYRGKHYRAQLTEMKSHIAASLYKPLVISPMKYLQCILKSDSVYILNIFLNSRLKLYSFLKSLTMQGSKN